MFDDRHPAPAAGDYPVHEALVTILVHHLATGFDLTAAEIERIEIQLIALVAHLRGTERRPLPASVVEEARSRRSQRALDDLHARGRTQSTPGTIAATRSDWTDQISRLISLTYALPDGRAAALAARVDAALSELGLCTDGHGRAAHHQSDQMTAPSLWGSSSG
ncbi:MULTISPECIES: hypothetical protein [unclassified Crossiella]|uniref:hypothetical protein n=1 Tax=unclassified Crossiella TaxID=2620835 RepID=UPI001FFFE71B|nr:MULTISPECIES: hypothetical protein [unclassified Crossiella]MCK2240981.1 hypothetical protein [Crossiella sp. S99.2]MCK2253875.1 hypothetical protein [Crossiella sp. S99.1]